MNLKQIFMFLFQSELKNKKCHLSLFFAMASRQKANALKVLFYIKQTLDKNSFSNLPIWNCFLFYFFFLPSIISKPSNIIVGFFFCRILLSLLYIDLFYYYTISNQVITNQLFKCLTRILVRLDTKNKKNLLGKFLSN